MKVNYIMLLQLVGIIVPLIGIFTLFKKEQNKTSMNLMVANVGCLIINGCYLLILQSSRYDEAMLALKMECLGSVLFYYYFICFAVSYLKIKVPKWLFNIWGIYEYSQVFLLWDNRFMNLIYQTIDFMHQQPMNFHYLTLHPGPLSIVRYYIINFILIMLLLYTLYRMHKTHVASERANYARLIGAEFVIIVSLIVTLTTKLSFDIVPICSSLAICSIIISVISGEFFSISDYGREWVFEHIDDAFVIVDNAYNYVDSNLYAKNLFKELESIHPRFPISNNLHDLIQSDDTEVLIDGRYYDKIVANLTMKDKVEGYCMVLLDTTERHQLMQELIVERDKAEAANRAKSIFMSNMSHEIRTPMNAIVGMSEILMREQLPDQTKGYVVNIKNSGEALLSIINDILDFSKIESGKLEIIEKEYEPYSMLSDLGMIIMNRIGSKPIELLFDISPDLPEKLYGDPLRIRQVIINIMNNAVKFTESGFVKLTISTEYVEMSSVALKIIVTDSGQGIKDEDKSKLFESFSQVDTKKNYGKEGTGLGLAISKQLVELMGGTISVESTYGIGSKFTVVLNQGVCSNKPMATINHNIDGNAVSVSTCMEECLTKQMIQKLSATYGLNYISDYTLEPKYIFVDSDNYRNHADRLKKLHNSKLLVLQNPLCEPINDPDVCLVNYPLYSANFCNAINGVTVVLDVDLSAEMSFEAPEAHVLIVDDNDLNLEVALGLLEPLHMKIDTASNGKEAINKIMEKPYDIVFMDHMMPIMDGIEATEYIRNLDGEYYQKLPIIALTANAIAEAKQSFVDAGMNDFIPKPMELKNVCASLRKWLPSQLIIENKTESKQEDSNNLPVIEGLHVKEGVSNCGSVDLYLKLLGDYYKMIDMKSIKIEKCLADGMIRDYTIEVHALKSSSRLIGALELSERFRQLEQLGKSEKIEELRKETPRVMEMYRGYKSILRPYGVQSSNLKECSADQIISDMTLLKDAVDEFDMDTADEAMKKLEGYRFPESCQSLMEELRAYVADVAMEDIIRICDQMIDIIQNESKGDL